MKKELIIGVSLIVLSLISCGKNESGNKSTIKLETSETKVVDNNGTMDTLTSGSSTSIVNGNKTETKSSIYKAVDGTLVKVIFTETPKESTLAITSNKKTFTLPKIKSDPKETIYQKDDMKATVKGDSLILNQDSNIIQLVKTKI
ncbi:hypothetical protein MUU74_02990 [Chryseobacterium daecheongense]|uniref:hypothetical protein n=1 Tax=Chryseobacterium daecheongense TaxID=192389 RepID=UPI001FD7146B|nr:hypothetical protein [Chryseobacterium daecheongense]UOU98926.1 hypothetical protein MUU74_02990 [Chryseobacterium daecheongense]